VADVKFEPINFTGLTIQSDKDSVILSQEHPDNGQLTIISIPMQLAYQVGLAVANCPYDLEMKCEKKSRKDE
jgi:hypothetical protein